MPGAILYIDDAPQLPDGFAGMLAAEGYELIHTEDPEEAMRLVGERVPVLVLMELCFSGCDGLDLLEGIRATWAELPVIVLTRDGDVPGLCGEAIAAGVKDFYSKPALASQLLTAAVEFALEPPPPEPPEPQPDPDEEPGGVGDALAGELSETPLAEVLRRLHRRAATGVLFLSQGDARIGVELRNGSLLAVSSNQESEALHDFLLRIGRIDAEQHQTVIDQVTLRMGSPSEVLLAIDALSEDEVGAASRRLAEEELFEGFRWTQGSYRFAEQRRLKSDLGHALERDPTHLIFAGVVEAMPLPLIRDRLRKRAGLYVSTTDECEILLDALNLTATQHRLLGALDGGSTLTDLLGANAFDERMLYGLWVGGSLDLQAAPTLALVDELSTVIEEVDSQPELELESDARRSASVAPPRPEPVRRSLREIGQAVLGVDDFAVLDVSEVTTAAQIRAAYEGLLEEIRGSLDSPDEDARQLARRIRDRVQDAYEHLRDPETRRAYALLRREEEQDREVKDEASRALDAERWFRKGEVALKRKRYDEAVEALGMASHLDPQQGEYRAHLGYALYLSNPRKEIVQREAIEHVATGIKRSPDREMSYVFLGRILRAKGDTETARKIFRKALRIKPDCHPARQELRLLQSRAKKKNSGLLARFRRR